jgi:hypothetical protein
VFRPAYLELLASGVLDERVDAAWAHLRWRGDPPACQIQRSGKPV